MGSCVPTLRWRSGTWLIWLAAILIWLVSTSVGCCKTPPAQFPVTQQLQCLDRPPPLLEASVPMGIRNDPCPPHTICLDSGATAALGLWIDALVQWSRAAWVRCGPVVSR